MHVGCDILRTVSAFWAVVRREPDVSEEHIASIFKVEE
jgi:hypothetical protein